MTAAKPQDKPQVKSPGAPTREVVEPGVTYAYNIVLDKAGSTAVAQLHLPLNMHAEDMQTYTNKALHVIEMVQLKFDRDKLKVELKLSAAMLDSLKEELTAAKIARDKEMQTSGKGRVAKPINQQLLAMDNNLRHAITRHEAMLADLVQMEQRLGPDSTNAN